MASTLPSTASRAVATALPLLPSGGGGGAGLRSRTSTTCRPKNGQLMVKFDAQIRWPAETHQASGVGRGPRVKELSEPHPFPSPCIFYLSIYVY